MRSETHWTRVTFTVPAPAHHEELAKAISAAQHEVDEANKRHPGSATDIWVRPGDDDLQVYFDIPTEPGDPGQQPMPDSWNTPPGGDTP